MDTEPRDQSQPATTLWTADELFARPDCTHIITLNNRSQNLHLERTPEGFRLIFGSAGAEGHLVRTFPRLDEVYRDWEQEQERERAPMRYNLREVIWRDISDYPALPVSPYSALYRPLGSPVELYILPDSEHSTAHGPHSIYGPATISTLMLHTYLVTATADWLVVVRPAFTVRGRGGHGILRPTPTRTISDRVRLNVDNFRLRHDKQLWTLVRPVVIVVYGKPPADWQTARQLLTA